MTLFRGAGVEAFRLALDAAVRDPDALRAWYPPVLNAMARTLPIRAVSIHGHWWTEIDSITDLDAARAAIARGARHAAQRVSALGARPG
jgi:hypothetical protein